jgi:hypothetical protein
MRPTLTLVAFTALAFGGLAFAQTTYAPGYPPKYGPGYPYDYGPEAPPGYDYYDYYAPGLIEGRATAPDPDEDLHPPSNLDPRAARGGNKGRYQNW